MLITLILQATKTITVTEGVLPAVYGTLVAAVLSLGASIYATVTSSKTAEKVATLSRQAAEELKEKDYKNDFYKKIIEKRLEAWEEAQELLKMITPSSRDLEDNKSFFTYFKSEEKFQQVIDKIRDSIATQTLWMGKDYIDFLRFFHNSIIMLSREINKLQKKSGATEKIDVDLEFRNTGKKHFEECKAHLQKMIKIMGEQVRILHDVEGFFNQLPTVSLYISDTADVQDMKQNTSDK